MRISRDLKGKRIRKPHWPSGDWYRVLFVGNFVVVAKDQAGVEVTFDNDLRDKDWVVIPDEEQHEAEEGPETTLNGKAG